MNIRANPFAKRFKKSIFPRSYNTWESKEINAFKRSRRSNSSSSKKKMNMRISIKFSSKRVNNRNYSGDTIVFDNFFLFFLKNSFCFIFGFIVLISIEIKKKSIISRFLKKRKGGAMVFEERSKFFRNSENKVEVWNMLRSSRNKSIES